MNIGEQSFQPFEVEASLSLDMANEMMACAGPKRYALFDEMTEHAAIWNETFGTGRLTGVGAVAPPPMVICLRTSAVALKTARKM